MGHYRLAKSTTTQVLFDAAVVRPTAPGLYSATNSDARNHGGENKKQDIYQIGGILWHRAHYAGKSLISSVYRRRPVEAPP